MKIGTYYYPEQWPPEQWERDFDNIAKLGLQIVHMAEFAWFELEPRPGEFQFDWLGHCLDLARQRKLDVILCTPPPRPRSGSAIAFPKPCRSTTARFAAASADAGITIPSLPISKPPPEESSRPWPTASAIIRP